MSEQEEAELRLDQPPLPLAAALHCREPSLSTQMFLLCLSSPRACTGSGRWDAGQEFCFSCPNHLQEAPEWLKSGISQPELGRAEPWAVTGGVCEHGVPGVWPPCPAVTWSFGKIQIYFLRDKSQHAERKEISHHEL